VCAQAQKIGGRTLAQAQRSYTFMSYSFKHYTRLFFLKQGIGIYPTLPTSAAK